MMLDDPNEMADNRNARLKQGGLSLVQTGR